MYNGSIEGWERQYKLKSPRKIPNILTNFINELKNICKVFERKVIKLIDFDYAKFKVS